MDVLELRAEETVQISIRVRGDIAEMISKRMVTGHSARTYVNGVWGFSFSEGSADCASTVRNARKAAISVRPHASKDRVGLAEVKSVRKEVRSKSKLPFNAVDIGEKIDYLKSLCTTAADSDERIGSCWADYYEITGKRYLVTSAGSVVEADVAEMNLIANASARKGGVQASARDELSTIMTGWDYLLKNDPPEDVASRLSRKIINQLEGASCRRGSFPCVLGPKVVGMLAHEALGHLSEADLFTAGAFNGMEGEKVAPEHVTMVDIPKMAGGFGNIEVDDEGVVPRKVVLIDDGILKDQLMDREWAFRMGRRPTGNARAESFRKPPIIRMRNTLFERGDHDVEELLESVGNGYYLGDVRGGQAESDSSFQVGIQECYEVVKGDIGRPVRDFAISGIAVNSLKYIEGVGNDFGYESSYCGKYDQSMATTDGGPSMSIAKGGIIFGGA